MKIQIADKFKKLNSLIKTECHKHGPEILITCGVIGVVTSTVLACVATTKINKVIIDAKEKIEVIHKERSAIKYNCISKETKCNNKNISKSLTGIYLKTGLKIVELYAPSIILGGLSLTGIVASNRILKKRSIAIAAAYATVDKSFRDYRNRVIERFGNEVDEELRYDIHKDTIKNPDKKSGKDEVVKKSGYDGVSDFARIFDSENPMYKSDNDFNLCFLRQEESFFNQKLVAQGYVYLNEVYKELGFEETMAGQVVGWLYNKNNSRGDNYIDFGIKEIATKDNGNEVEYGFLLDFNVDGDILTYAHKE